MPPALERSIETIGHSVKTGTLHDQLAKFRKCFEQQQTRKRGHGMHARHLRMREPFCIHYASHVSDKWSTCRWMEAVPLLDGAIVGLHHFVAWRKARRSVSRPCHRLGRVRKHILTVSHPIQEVT